MVSLHASSHVVAVAFAIITALAGLFLLGGCNKGDRPELGTVVGAVTLDGKPSPAVRLVFEPVEGGRASVGVTDADGRYELTYIRRDKGAKVGAHKVRISAANAEDGEKAEIPPQYSSGQTVLQANVQSGANEINFELKP